VTSGLPEGKEKSYLRMKVTLQLFLEV